MIRYNGKQFSLAGNPVMANYEMEDAAARLLYESGQRFKTPKKADCMKLARYMGVSVRDEYLSDSPYSLCAVALENQTLRTSKGRAVVMAAGDIVVEKAIKDGGDERRYSYAVFHGLSHIYLHNRENDDRQLSFDLTGTQSEKHFLCDSSELDDIYVDARLDSRPESEGQADTFAGCLMLPKVPFKTAANKFMGGKDINRADLKGETLDEMVKTLADIFAAPEIVVALRLKKLLYL